MFSRILFFLVVFVSGLFPQTNIQQNNSTSKSLYKFISKFVVDSLIDFENFPEHLQFFARDADDSSEVLIDGVVKSTLYSSIAVNIFKNNLLIKRDSKPLTLGEGFTSFSFREKIHAELSEYSFLISLQSASDTIAIAFADSIVCGDVFLVNGQSNSHWGEPQASYRNEYCRSFGAHTDVYPFDITDTNVTWGLSVGEKKPKRSIGGPHDKYFVGVWPLLLQQHIKENFSIPTCIINGGSGGSYITQNLPSTKHEMDLDTPYGRLLYRTQKAKLQDKVKAIFWYQGESDSEPSWKDYLFNFSKLYKAWKDDYNPVNRIYLFQVRPGCSDGGDYPSKLREVQRVIPNYFNDVKLMSTVAIPGHDGCHYYYEGCKVIAQQIFRLVARDYYSISDQEDIDPPNIVKVYFSNAQHNELVLEFANCKEIVWPKDTLGHRMEDAFYLDNKYGQIVSGSAEKNIVRLQLSAPSVARTINYLPGRYYEAMGDYNFYEGPFLKNSKEVGALSFYSFIIGGTTSDISYREPSNPEVFLDANYPNPFNGATKIRYRINLNTKVNISIYDNLGRKKMILRDSYLLAGEYTQSIDASGWPSGIYICLLRAGNLTQTTRIVLLK